MLLEIIESRIKFSALKLNGKLASEEAGNFLYDNIFLLSRSIAEDANNVVECPYLFKDEPILARSWLNGQESWANSQY